MLTITGFLAGDDPRMKATIDTIARRQPLGLSVVVMTGRAFRAGER
jgi:hypothetical protein